MSVVGGQQFVRFCAVLSYSILLFCGMQELTVGEIEEIREGHNTQDKGKGYFKANFKNVTTIEEHDDGEVGMLQLYEANYVGITDSLDVDGGSSEVWIRCGSLGSVFQRTTIHPENVKIILFRNCSRTEAYVSERVPGVINRGASVRTSSLVYIISFGNQLRPVYIKMRTEGRVPREFLRLIPCFQLAVAAAQVVPTMQELIAAEFEKPKNERDIGALCEVLNMMHLV